MSDLTTLANVKAWLGITTTDAARDALLTRQITSQSRWIENWLSRIIASRSYTEVRDGFGAGRGRYMMTFANDPVSTVTSLTVNGFAVPLSPDGGVKQPGYGFDSEQIWLSPVGPYLDKYNTGGYEFARGQRNVL